MGTQRYVIDYSGSYDYSPSSTARLGGLPPDAEPPLTDRPSHPPVALLRRDYSWQLRSSAQSGWAPRLGSPGSRRPPPERVLVARWPPLLRSLWRPLRRPPPSARGLLQQPPALLVSTSPWASPQGFRSLRLQRLSTRRHVHQRHLTTTTTLWGYYNLSRVLTFDYAGFRQRSLSSRLFGLRLRGGSGLLSGWRGFFFRHRCRGFIPLPGQIR
jgi:hypothetical protein